MSQLVWWAIFVVPTLAAVGWAAQRAESRPGDAFDSVAAHNRFVEALSRGDRSGDEPE